MREIKALKESMLAAGIALPEKPGRVALIEHCIAKHNTNDRVRIRWTALEEAILAVGLSRLMVMYAVRIQFRWEEAEPVIRKSKYLYNYLQDVLRGLEKSVFLHPEKVTAELVNGAWNAETRRVLVDLMGVERYLADSKAEVVHTDCHPLNGNRALLRVQTGMRQQEQWLMCQCPSTGRMYFLTLPRVRLVQVERKDSFGKMQLVWDQQGINTCDDADRWIAGDLDANQVGRS